MSATQTIGKTTTTKENERPPLARLNLQKTTYPGGLGGGMTTPYKPAMPNRPPRPSSIHQRAFHREPYPATSPTSPHSPQFLTLPVLPSPTCPTFQSVLGPRSLSYAPTRTSLLSISQLRIIGTFYDSELFWLSLYFLFNLGLTLYNKGVLTRFPFPYTLSAVHALCGSVGGLVLVKTGFFLPTPLNFTETCVLVAFSVLYTVNIIVSNISLGMVTIPFHQVVRASTPIFTIAFSTSLLGTEVSRLKLTSLIPVMVGVGFATYGDYYFTRWGFILTLFGTVLAALKSIATNLLQSSPIASLPHSPRTKSTYEATTSIIPIRLRLHPLDLLLRMSPLAFIQCVLLAYTTGELDRVRHYSQHSLTAFKFWALLINGIIAFGLNVVSFTANRRTGAVSMSVAANVKQVLTILIAVVVFDLTITKMNATGILLTLAGGGWYAKVEFEEKKKGKGRHSKV